jgi:hypothetical protein
MPAPYLLDLIVSRSEWAFKLVILSIDEPLLLDKRTYKRNQLQGNICYPLEFCDEGEEIFKSSDIFVINDVNAGMIAIVNIECKVMNIRYTLIFLSEKPYLVKYYVYFTFHHIIHVNGNVNTP